jgi:hypothetical protein
MVKKSTLILLILFAVSVAVLIYIQRTPSAEYGNEPTPTLANFLVTGWSFERINSIELVSGQGTDIVLTISADQTWQQKNSTDPIESQLVSEFINHLLSLNVSTSLDVSTPLESIGLADASNVIILRDSSGSSLNIRIGSLTPTGNNYYVQLDTTTPVACDRAGVDTLLGYYVPGAFSPQLTIPEGMQLTPAGP